MIRHSDFERTISHAERALDHLRANQIPAYPRSYELWYTYVAGFNRPLNRALNDAITRYGQVPESVIQEIYEEHLSPTRITDRVEAVSNKFLKEFERVLGLIDDARDSTGDYEHSLQSAAQELVSAKDGGQVKLVVQSLLAATKEMERHANTLEGRLAESKRQIDVLHENLEAVRNETITDALTGIANRKHFDQALRQSVADATETNEPLCLLMGDIDHFKSFNDNFGHQTGDQVLRLVAHALKTNVKGRDLAARYGGEEFAVILPQTSLHDAVTVAEHIRKTIMAKELVKKSTGESLGTITMSLGAALYRAGEAIDSFISRADACLYSAKKDGRNRVKAEDGVEQDVVSEVA